MKKYGVELRIKDLKMESICSHLLNKVMLNSN